MAAAASRLAEPVSEDPAAFVAHFAEGWRAPGSADAFVDHFAARFHPSARFVQPRMPTVVGIDAFRERFVRPLFALLPDLRAEVDGWAARGETLFIEFRLVATVGGRVTSWPATDRITLRDGRLVERVSYQDPAPLLAAVARTPRLWSKFARAQIAARRTRGGRR